MKTYPSKIGLELIIPLSLLLGGVGLGMLWENNWPGLLIVAASSAFVGHLLLTTHYKIDGNKLLIKSGFLFSETLDIHTIRRVTATRNPISSPAASLDRLEITYNMYDSVLISPKDRADFINHLLTIKPDIIVDPDTRSATKA